MPSWFGYVNYAIMGLTALVHSILAWSIWVNAAERERDQKPLMYMGSSGWALTTLLFGIFGLLTYWLVHHSALRKLYNEDPPGKGQ